MNLTLGLIIGAVALLVVVVMLVSYVKAPPSNAFIISGLSKEPRVLIGKGGFRIPFLERMNKIFLGQITVDVKTSIPVPTHDFIDVMVDAVCKVRVTPNIDGYRLAARNFLDMSSNQIAAEIKDSLEGNMREVVGAITLQNLVTDRDKFSDEIQSKAAKDMAKLGLEVISCNIQNITDKNSLIEGLGADNTYAIRKNAAITKANAEKDIAIAEQEAKKEANDVKVKTETEIAERNNDLAIKKAELKLISDTKQADADAAYEIQKQEQQKTINVKTVDAQIEQTKREQVLSEERIKIKQNELTAEVNKRAEADKYKTETNAAAVLEQRKRDAEAKAYEAEQEALAVKAKAEAKKYEMLQNAEGIKAEGEAKAYSIQLQGEAEAKAMEKKAEAYDKYGAAAIIEMLTKIMPQMAEKVAQPISAIDSVNIYGSNGSGVSEMSNNVPTVMKQTFDVIENITGVNMADVVRSQTIDAKVNRNYNVSGGILKQTDKTPEELKREILND